MITGEPLVYDPFTPDFPWHAHRVYDRMRAEEPFHWAPRVGEWIVTRHADVKAVLRHGDLRPSDMAAIQARAEWDSGLPLPALKFACQEMLLLQSGHGHMQARRFLAKVLNHRPVAESAPLIERIVAERVEDLRKAGGGDLVADFARAVPLRFMGGLLGVPAEEMEFMADCTDGLLFVLERGMDLEQRVDANSRAAMAIDHVAGLLAERRMAPREDGLSRMLELAGDDPSLDDRTLAARVLFLFVAGLDTTTTFLGQSMQALLLDDKERGRLRRREVTEATAVEELLRFTGVGALVIREAADDCEVAGRFVAKGQRVAGVIEAANRDPEVFNEPHRLDLGRSPCPHLAFSDGVHACLGASLARMKGVIALRAFTAMPEMRMVESPRVARAGVLRAFGRLPVVFK